MNRCPACKAKIKPHEVACRVHWYQVPKVMRDRVWELFKVDRGSDAHRAAVFEVVKYLAERQPGHYVCTNCGHVEDQEREIQCQACGRGEMVWVDPKAPPPEQTKVKCLRCGFLVDKAGPCSEHSPFRQTGPGGRTS